MPRVSTSILPSGALLALLALLITTPIYAEDPAIPSDPGARIQPPIGLTEARIKPPIGVATEEAVRILPPIGAAMQPDVRIGPPGGIASQPESPSMIELLWEWLRVRIGPPTG